MKIAFVIVNYQHDDNSLSIIKDLLACDRVPKTKLSIYLVDNSPLCTIKDKLPQSSNLHLIENPENTGFSGGNNLGFSQAIKDRQDIIVALNDDTIVPKDFIKQILHSPINEKKVGLVGGLIYFAKGFEYEKGYLSEDRGKVIWYAGGQIDWNNVYGNHRGVNEVDSGQYRKISETDFVTGCLFITKRSVLKKVGIFDPKFFMYHEDTDLSLRIKSHGYQVLFDPNIKIWHKVAQSSRIGSPLNDYFLTRNRLIIAHKYSSFRTKFAILRQSLLQLFTGSAAQKTAILDFFQNKLGKGSFVR